MGEVGRKQRRKQPSLNHPQIGLGTADAQPHIIEFNPVGLSMAFSPSFQADPHILSEIP